MLLQTQMQSQPESETSHILFFVDIFEYLYFYLFVGEV